MSEGGAALMAVGTAEGDDRARLAAEQAISSRLLDVTIDGAQGILFNVTGGPDLSLFEVNQAAAIIRETTHPDANMIFGAVIDETMGDAIRITVIATGFERSMPSRRQVLQDRYGQSSAAGGTTARSAPTSSAPASNAPSPAQERELQEVEQEEQAQPKFSPNNLDIPAFLRRR